MRELLQCMLRTSFLAKTIDEQKEADHRFFFVGRNNFRLPVIEGLDEE